MKDFIWGIVAAVVIIGAFLFVIGSFGKSESLGAVSGPDVSFAMFFRDGITVGGYTLATSSQGAATYAATDISKTKVIEHIATGALTATLPTNAALSAAGFLKYAGDTYTLFIHASTSVITLAGNTGVSLQSASSTKTIPPGNTGRIDFIRLPVSEAARIDAILTTD